MRKKDCDKNSLPWEFASFVSKLRPKFTILENVTGILRAFQDDGEKYYAWIEVSKAFSQIGYIPLCLHVNAKFAGVPQNRPRFIMIGVREDIYSKLSKSFTTSESKLFSTPFAFYNDVRNAPNSKSTKLKYHDVINAEDLELFKDSFLSELVSHSENFVSVSDAIDDLRFNGDNSLPSKYITTNYDKLMHGVTNTENKLSNHEERRNGELVRRRFRIYQIMQIVGNGLAKEVRTILKGDINTLNDEYTLSDEAWSAFSEHEYLVGIDELVKFKYKSDFIGLLREHPTKKQTQKALNPDLPAPAALSIPDDACHYHQKELRTLTVREMARIQSFPDSFVFRSKVTTGGKMRRFEVPQYTQVGNAVPPLLAYHIAKKIESNWSFYFNP
jgi:DNA (cytosine-5)-methyltransferase 1